ncbi:MAG: TGS domain-containing protein, partial [Gammaproteobacteria bacterium]|nr:TGS domain-containing protein [Gammaproteobacteria bacterium]
LLLLVNKDDDERHDEDYEIFCELTDEEWPCIPISVTAGRNLERLKQEVFTRLNVMRVFAKPPGKDADLAQPFVLQSGSTVDEFARKIHLDFHEQLKSARVWGSAAYDGQMVGRDYVLQDGDIVELRI